VRSLRRTSANNQGPSGEELHGSLPQEAGCGPVTWFLDELAAFVATFQRTNMGDLLIQPGEDLPSIAR
jgi:hypothetical protein